MANQLCHRAETNHCMAESITVSHGNTSPQVSLFIKLGSPPTLVSAVGTRVTWVFGVHTLPTLSGWLIFLWAFRDISSQRNLTSRDAKLDQSKDGWRYIFNNNKNFIQAGGQVIPHLRSTQTMFSIGVFASLFSTSSTKAVNANVISVSLTSQ